MEEEEGVKEGGENLRGAQMADKAGWIKKSSGGLLGLWKDRYLLLSKAQLLVYENEDEQNCIETVELGSYEKCQDYRALLKKKHRFILLRSPGNKVHDIKFQAQNGEEKDSWIKALNEGINKGKNKAFDEVKVDKSCALEHVTRDRVRGGQRRRPPTRIHLKEVANAASDGLLRLDLDVPDSGPPSFTSPNNISDSPPTEIPRPPMPPTKPSQDPEKPNLENSAEKPEAEESTPTPAADNSQDHPEPQAMAETTDEVLEASALSGGSKENLTEESKSLEKPPEPPPKVKSDKLKVSWENPSPESSTPVGKELDQPSGSETASKEGGKPPAPPPKILSEKLKASLKGKETTSQDQCQDSQASKTPDPDPDCSQVSVNGMADSVSEVEPILESSPQRAVEDTDAQETPLKEDKGKLDPSEPGTAPLEDKGAQEGSEAPGIQDGSPVLPLLQPRCASLGNLLTDSDKGQGLLLDRHQLVKIEKKVTSEREKTEQLLSQVLGKELEHAQEGNGPPVNAEVLLNQAVEQLRQATQVLQEIKVLGELNKEPSTSLTEKQKEKQKDLMTLYRRSAP